MRGPRVHVWEVEVELGVGPYSYSTTEFTKFPPRCRYFTTRERDLHELERAVTATDRDNPRPIIRAIYLGRIANAEGEEADDE